MSLSGWITIAAFFLCVVAMTRPLGGYLQRVLEGQPHFLGRIFGPLERGLYRVAGIRWEEEQSWVQYATGVVLFSAVSFVVVYALLRFQVLLPLNPAGLGPVAPDLAYNTSISFVTNTNWQSYGGETTMSHLSQMLALAVQNFVSAAVGIAVAAAVIRGFARRGAGTIGNVWTDLVRVTLYVLLPISVVVALFFVWQGVPQTLHGSVEVTTLEGARQTIALGPVATQEAIKMLGTNGGGFFNTNSAHPFENPTALSNFVQVLCIFALGTALTNLFGRMVGREREGWAIFSAMALLFLIGVGVTYWAEAHANPAIAALGVDPALGNMEGKETRFGIAASALFATVTTDASCGAVNAMHESFLPLGGLVPLVNMMLGEVIIGGVGAGLYGVLLFAIIAVFMAGLMVGRTPEYLGKKIEAREVKMTMLAVLCLPLVMLGFTAIAVVTGPGLSALSATGPHGFTEALYAYSSAAANNGSAFGGLTANPFWNLALGIGMVVGRFFIIIPVLAIAGAMAAKKVAPATSGTFPTDNGLFIALVSGVIVIVGGLTFLPALALGPIVEHLTMLRGTLF
ncbi:potassium-transporting ATPase potassium-binding subunit [Gluconacetobacter liquefaciens]|uniref:Potassium-transporting ATPase potassium-binding subunit n=1 Tax=Gluconacetobacter liquefaciens TaxID=89584 RepID=A0A370G2A4_GLULI|nr:potassium-transporting ATPase subunit KdpA [Gluconacetobacter liquefaciens]MBB2187006.1 potassium-transporting ATPase subunit KdpA [Gluconacetobacter liquefaciens]RDI36979.1 K+-transporting ATPase ATPase A chain [Gluconacetobacter liquefaciens]GBR00730.1 potassium-transporting ATPase subunit A [Gluconacetobacter liquefaciens NRIC 0522]GEB38760.1 potassium-transporting ATPase potassium-binding subunit [Gluconacetobacter liquefaciens]